MQTLADDGTVVIKKLDKESCDIVWDRNDYIKEAQKELNDTNVYKDVSFNHKLLEELVGTCNKLFRILKAKGLISDKKVNYFTYQYKKVASLGKLHLLPKIHTRSENVPGRPVISICGTPTEKDSGDFINKIKEL